MKKLVRTTMVLLAIGMSIQLGAQSEMMSAVNAGPFTSGYSIRFSDDQGAGLQSPGFGKEEKKGYFDIELFAGETMYSNVNVKLGVERIYGIIRFGFSAYESNLVYSYGLGVGTRFTISDRQSFSIDLSGNQVIYDFDFASSLNLLNKVDFNYKIGLTDRFALLIGPSYNVYLTREKVNNEFGTLDIPYTISENEQSESALKQWIGINAGFSIRL